MIIENKEKGIWFGVDNGLMFNKWLADHDKQIRDEVIFKFADKLKGTKLELDGVPKEIIDALEMTLYAIASDISEKLKEEIK